MYYFFFILYILHQRKDAYGWTYDPHIRSGATTGPMLPASNSFWRPSLDRQTTLWQAYQLPMLHFLVHSRRRILLAEMMMLEILHPSFLFGFQE